MPGQLHSKKHFPQKNHSNKEVSIKWLKKSELSEILVLLKKKKKNFLPVISLTILITKWSLDLYWNIQAFNSSEVPNIFFF